LLSFEAKVLFRGEKTIRKIRTANQHRKMQMRTKREKGSMNYEEGRKTRVKFMMERKCFVIVMKRLQKVIGRQNNEKTNIAA
jgi:hypothetical protein